MQAAWLEKILFGITTQANSNLDRSQITFFELSSSESQASEKKTRDSRARRSNQSCSESASRDHPIRDGRFARWSCELLYFEGAFQVIDGEDKVHLDDRGRVTVTNAGHKQTL